MDVLVRKAEQTDCHFLAQVMYESMIPGVGRGVFDVCLEGTGVAPLLFHETLLRMGANNWGQLDSFFVLDTPEQAQVGAMGAYLSGMPDMRPLSAQGFKVVSEALGWSQDVERTFWRKYITFFGAFGNAPQLAQPADYVLEYGSIHPNFRGRGLYGLLFSAHAGRAKSLNFRTMGGTAIFGNASVVRTFEKFGFVETARFGPEYFRGAFPGLTRYVKML